MAASPPPKIDQIQGTVKILTYVNPENGYFVAKVAVGNAERTVVGSAPVINVGEQIRAKGTWQTSNWGPQFKATEVFLSPPTMLESIERYLASAVEGIGKGYAKKLVQAFGHDVFDIIENSPEKLNDVKGIGKKRAESILVAYREQQAVREIMVFLHSCGLSTLRAKQVYDKYGEDAVARIRSNPYDLCRDIWGIGFSTADEVAAKQGIAPTSGYRVKAGIQHVLREATSRGSCGLPVAKAAELAGTLLNVPVTLVNECLLEEIKDNNLVKDHVDMVDCVFLPLLYQQESFIARRLLEMANRPVARVIPDIDGEILNAEVEVGLELDPVQRDALRVALASQVCVITGGPGTGKTTITRLLIHALSPYFKCMNLCAPTGKAAKRAEQSTGMPGQTVHRMLKVEGNGRFKYNENNPMMVDVVLMDEGSMTDVPLAYAILKAMPPTARLVIIGDVDQIPSVGPGKVLADIIDSEAVPTVKLRAIFRQAATSSITRNAHAVNNGQMPETGGLDKTDFWFYDISPSSYDDENDKKQCREMIERRLLQLARDMYKKGFDPIRDVQVLAPMRKGILGVESLNQKLQGILNPSPTASMELFGRRWQTGDKVMQLRNNYDKNVFNGDVGYVTDVDSVARTVVVAYEGLEPIEYKANELDELTLAYAMTIHKSQGSECPVVIIPIDGSHFTMLKRNLLYTGITRARKICVVIGNKRAVRIAVSTNQNEDRYSRLKMLLKRGLPKELRE